MENRNNGDKKLLKFLGKVAIGVVASTILTPPVALYLGSVTYGTSKCLEYMVEEEDQETCRFISSCAIDVATGGLIDCAVGTKVISLISQETKLIGHTTSKEIAQHGATDVAKELIKSGKKISKSQRNLEFIRKTKELCSTALELTEQLYHKKHLDKGINYLESCEVCNE